MVKYIYGYYWFVSSSQHANAYIKLTKEDPHAIIPDDVISMGELEF